MSKNVYDKHPVLSEPGTFWRCKHGSTGWDWDGEWVGCKKCAWNKGFTQWIKYYWNKWHNI